MQKKLNFRVLGAGAWGLSFRNIDQLNALVSGELIEDDGAKGPKPEIIPANERRRAPLPVRLAVESSWQACQQSGLAPEKLKSVFVSGLGDTQLTDYMCKALMSEHKALSPTKFHNSVHNAAASYWTISTGCMHAANSIAGFQESTSLAILDALIQAETEQAPILMTFYDAPVAELLLPMLRNQVAFSFSMVVQPCSLDSAPNAPSFTAELVQDHVDWPTLTGSEDLIDCYQTNPAARVLAFANMLNGLSTSTVLPLSEATALKIKVS